MDQTIEEKEKIKDIIKKPKFRENLIIDKSFSKAWINKYFSKSFF